MSRVAEALRRVASALPGGGEVRPGQQEMAEAVARAIASQRHLVVQAGTGTGKSLAYLVPAVLSGRRTVVATATRALQDQLAHQDLPFLAANLGRRFRFAVVKGRSNYLCRQRAAEHEIEQLRFGDRAHDAAKGTDEETDGSELGDEVAALIEWGRASVTGDRAELSFEPSPRAWANVSVTSLECPGAANCPAGEECFAEAALARAGAADVVVVNTHLYGVHLAGGGNLLPDHDVLVVDEAHALEDIAAATLGLELAPARFRSLAGELGAVLGPRGVEEEEARSSPRRAKARGPDGAAGVVGDLIGAGERLEQALRGWHGRRLPPDLDTEVAAAVALAAERVARASSLARERENGALAPRRARALQEAGHLAGDLAVVADLGPGRVAWVEGPPSAPVLKVAAVDVAAELASRLWGEVTAVLTSATVPLNLPARLGLPPGTYDQLEVASPFPYADHALLYCPVGLPDPRHPRYQAAMHAELEALIRAGGGRTLALFTSWRAMEAAASALRPRLPWRVLTQSDLPKPALVEEFRADEASCLFATLGFWQGIDVPGPAVSLVTLDRLPFPRPDDPLTQARREQAGQDAFRLVDLPRAATLLAQGAGRLVRSASDRGVVAVLDPRLVSAPYGRDLWRRLPPMGRTRRRAEVEAFLSALHRPAGAPGAG